jgi:hypothetical protein
LIGLDVDYELIYFRQHDAYEAKVKREHECLFGVGPLTGTSHATHSG